MPIYTSQNLFEDGLSTSGQDEQGPSKPRSTISIRPTLLLTIVRASHESSHVGDQVSRWLHSFVWGSVREDLERDLITRRISSQSMSKC